MEKLFHFSEDPTINLFRPHVAVTSSEIEPFVWALDEEHAPSYWFHAIVRARVAGLAKQHRSAKPVLLWPWAERVDCTQ